MQGDGMFPEYSPVNVNSNNSDQADQNVNNNSGSGGVCRASNMTIIFYFSTTFLFVLITIIVLLSSIVWKPEPTEFISNCENISESIIYTENNSSWRERSTFGNGTTVEPIPKFCTDSLPLFRECGHPETDIFVFGRRRKRVIGGGPVCNRNYYPWIAKLLIPIYDSKSGQVVKKHNCGATVISSRYLLTAAHCVKCHNVEEVELRNRKRMKVDKVIIYPSYQRNCSQKENFTREHDIALIRLKDTITVEPICLPLLRCYGMNNTDLNIKVKKAFVAGYGFTRNGNDSKEASDDLHHVALDKFSDSRCIEVYKPDVVNKDIMMCTSGSGRDFCKGDSGGPLFTTVNSRSVQLGIASFGSKVCGDGSPSVFTKIMWYMSWIKTETANLT